MRFSHEGGTCSLFLFEKNNQYFRVPFGSLVHLDSFPLGSFRKLNKMFPFTSNSVPSRKLKFFPCSCTICCPCSLVPKNPWETFTYEEALKSLNKQTSLSPRLFGECYFMFGSSFHNVLVFTVGAIMLSATSCKCQIFSKQRIICLIPWKI